MTVTIMSLIQRNKDVFNPSEGAGKLDKSDRAEITETIKILVRRAWGVTDLSSTKNLATQELKERADEWAKEASRGGRILAYTKPGPQTVALIKSPGIQAWDNWTVPMSLREVEPGVRLIMDTSQITDDQEWKPRPVSKDED